MQVQTNKRFITFGAVAVLLAGMLLAGLFGWFRTPTVQAQPSAQITPTTLPRTVTVVGEGKVSIEPDTARATIGVEVLRPSVQEASAENSGVISNVLAALQAQGIAEEDIQTSGFTIFAERYGPEGTLPEDQVNYRVSNNVNVVIRDLDSVGTVLDAAVEAGANNIYGIEFSLEDQSTAESEARAQAVEDARTKAEELAGLTGVVVGSVVSVSEVVGGNGGFYSSSFAEQASVSGGAPIAPGQLELVLQLQVVYEMADAQ